MVIDTSVVAKWFVEEDERDKSILVRNQLLSGKISLVAPRLLIYEMGNVLTLNTNLNSKEISDALRSLVDIGLEIYVMGFDELEMATKISRKFNITFYDAVFASLAKILNTKLVTADKSLSRKLREPGFLTLLQDYPD